MSRRSPDRGRPADAGFWLRVGAKLLDHGVFAVVEVALIGLGAYLNALGHPPWVIAAGFVVSTALWYVYIYELTRRRGQTLGKIAARVRVVTPAGAPPGARIMLLRLAVEFVFDMAPIVFMAVGWLLALSLGLSVAVMAIAGGALGGLVSLINPAHVLVSPRRQAVHDRIAGTYVLRLERAGGRAFVAGAAAAAALPLLTTFAVVRPFLVEAYFVPSGSMEPTIEIGDRILANKLVPRLREPMRREIVMFEAPAWAAAGREVFVKRIVGVAGDRLQVLDGALRRDGLPVSEPYIMEPPRYIWPSDAREGGEVVVPPGSVVVLGDNRNNSSDSHSWTRIGADGRREPAPFLPVETIRGKLVYRYWPPDRMGTVAQEE